MDCHWLLTQHGLENGVDMPVYLELYMMSTPDTQHDEENSVPTHCISRYRKGRGRDINKFH